MGLLLLRIRSVFASDLGVHPGVIQDANSTLFALLIADILRRLGGGHDSVVKTPLLADHDPRHTPERIPITNRIGRCDSLQVLQRVLSGNLV